jgi:hypothetical protein
VTSTYGAWEKRVRDLVESAMGPSDEALRQDVLDFLMAGEHGLAVETLADWIGEDGMSSASHKTTVLHSLAWSRTSLN